MDKTEDANIGPQMVNRLYDEAVDLADEARSYFGLNSKGDRTGLDPMDRLLYTSESLRISTRLMHVISWLLVRKAVACGEITEAEGMEPERRLGDRDLCRASDLRDLRRLPPMVASLALRSQALYDRAARMEDSLLRRIDGDAGLENPVAKMLNRIQSTY